MNAASASRTVSPRRRRIRRIGLVALLAGLVALVAAVVWAVYPLAPEPEPLAAAQQLPGVTVSDDAHDAIVLSPETSNGAGLVFLPGAKVDARAYEWKLSALVAEGTTVVIAEVPLGYAIAETRPLAEFTSLAPEVGTWWIGGHSLGGVRACQYAADDTAALSGLVLFGSYCAADLADSGLAVLSISGSEDGLSTPAKIEAAAHLLPADADFVEIPGASHAQFGDYGLQSGDGTATATDDEVRAAIAAAVARWAGFDVAEG